MDKVKSLILRVTERCNLNCIYCYAAGQEQIDMSPEIAMRAVELCCPERGSLRVQFTGGEPLLNLETMEAVYNFGKVTGRRLRFSVQTNGTLLTSETCKRLKAMDCAVGVSLDGLGEANSLRVFTCNKPSFEVTVQGIQNLGMQGMRCNITTVVTKRSVLGLGQLPDLALWLGNVEGVGLDLFRSLGRGAEAKLAPSADELAIGLQALVRRQEVVLAAGVSFRFRELERLKKRSAFQGCTEIYCYAQTEQSLAVDARGDFWPCSSLVGQQGYLLGNVQKGLPKIPRNNLDLQASATCTSCSAFAYCAGGCPAGRIALGGEPDELSCVMNRILMEELERRKEL